MSSVACSIISRRSPGTNVHGTLLALNTKSAEIRFGEAFPSLREHPRILVVDDDPDTLAMLQVWLAEEGFDVGVANDGFEALWRIREQLPDLVVTDYSMPGMTGTELCSELRVQAKTARVPVILYTGHASEVVGEPCDRVIQKPAILRDFSDEIRTLLVDSCQPSRC